MRSDGSSFPGPEIDKPDFIILSHQRSGTHFLQASLASHPRVHARDECLMHFRGGENGRRDAKLITYDLRNRPGACNLAIVNYSQVPLFKEKCGPLSEVGVIHLLRNPAAVALSMAKMKAEKMALGEKYRPHYHLGEVPHSPAAVSSVTVEQWEAAVQNDQKKYEKELAGHPRLLTIYYEALTDNRQTNTLPEEMARRLLSFLGLPYMTLRNELRKTG